LKRKKKYVVVVALALLVMSATSVTSAIMPAAHYKNLSVLPKNISSKDLQEIMVDDFEDGLGVTCGFCHADAQGGHGLDYASDKKPEKEIARAMMRMTMGINKKYFKVKHPFIGSSELQVTCTTCHNGTAFPDGTGSSK
jgi:hypothetical protein